MAALVGDYAASVGSDAQGKVVIVEVVVCPALHQKYSLTARVNKFVAGSHAELEGRIRLRGDHRLAAAEEIDFDQQQPGLDARHVERQHAGRLDVERLSLVH